MNFSSPTAVHTTAKATYDLFDDGLFNFIQKNRGLPGWWRKFKCWWLGHNPVYMPSTNKLEPFDGYSIGCCSRCRSVRWSFNTAGLGFDDMHEGLPSESHRGGIVKQWTVDQIKRIPKTIVPEQAEVGLAQPELGTVA